jgi:hypothetical protein
MVSQVRFVVELSVLNPNGIESGRTSIITIYIEFTLPQVFEFSFQPKPAFGSSTTEQGECDQCIENKSLHLKKSSITNFQQLICILQIQDLWLHGSSKKNPC